MTSLEVSFDLPFGNRIAGKVWTNNADNLKYFETYFPSSFELQNGFYVEVNPKQPVLQEDSVQEDKKDFMKIVAIHGWLDNCNSFDILMPELLKYLPDAVVVCVDLAGHGHSSHRPQQLGYSFHHYIRDIYHVTQLLRWTEFNLIGHSLGGACAVFLASVLPQVQTLCLIESLGALTRPPSQGPAQLRSYLQQPYSTRIPAYKSFEDAVKARMRGHRIPHEAAELLVRRNITPSLKWKTDKMLTTITPLSYSEDQVKEYIKQIQCPVQLVIGDGTWEGFDWSSRHKMFHNIQVEKFKGGHHLHMEREQVPTIAQTMSRFINSVSSKL